MRFTIIQQSFPSPWKPVLQKSSGSSYTRHDNVVTSRGRQSHSFALPTSRQTMPDYCHGYLVPLITCGNKPGRTHKAIAPNVGRFIAIALSDDLCSVLEASHAPAATALKKPRPLRANTALLPLCGAAAATVTGGTPPVPSPARRLLRVVQRHPGRLILVRRPAASGPPRPADTVAASDLAPHLRALDGNPGFAGLGRGHDPEARRPRCCLSDHLL